MVLSRLAVAKNWRSECQSQENTGPLWAENLFVHLSGFLLSQIWMKPFSEAAANTWLLCGLNWTSLILSESLKQKG